jgi:hypothetical protein
VVCGFSAGVTEGTTGLIIWEITGQTPGIPGTRGRGTAGTTLNAPGGRGRNKGRIIAGYGEG